MEAMTSPCMHRMLGCVAFITWFSIYSVCVSIFNQFWNNLHYWKWFLCFFYVQCPGFLEMTWKVFLWTIVSCGDLSQRKPQALFDFSCEGHNLSCKPQSGWWSTRGVCLTHTLGIWGEDSFFVLYFVYYELTGVGSNSPMILWASILF